MVADEIDILILLLYHCYDNMRPLYFLIQWKEPGAGKGSKLKVMQWETCKLASNFNYNNLLFAHAWCGWDTKSALYKKSRCNYNF